ncbi:MAG: COX15/CtaA family protein [Bryobacteraceae bacterium]|jgi:heme A synthase
MNITEQEATIARAQGGVARFGRAAWGVLAYNVLVVLWGALVRATGSGAGCGGHWPLCNGEVVPNLQTTATVIEYTHRLMSGLAIFAVCGLWLWSRSVFPRGHRARWWAGLSAVLLAIEALLGAGLVLFDYVAHNASIGRVFYLAVHLANTQILLAALAMTAWRATRGQALVRANAPGVLQAALPLVIAVSMTGAVVALGDTLFPAPSLGAGLAQDFSPAAHLLLRLRIVHPLLAVLVGFFLLYAASSAVRARPSAAVKRMAAAVAGLALAQLAAGAVNTALLALVWMQIVHLLLANLLWMALVLLAVNAAAAEERP